MQHLQSPIHQVRSGRTLEERGLSHKYGSWLSPGASAGLVLCKLILPARLICTLTGELDMKARVFQRDEQFGGLTLEISQGACLDIQCHTVPAS